MKLPLFKLWQSHDLFKSIGNRRKNLLLNSGIHCIYYLPHTFNFFSIVVYRSVAKKHLM